MSSGIGDLLDVTEQRHPERIRYSHDVDAAEIEATLEDIWSLMNWIDRHWASDDDGLNEVSRRWEPIVGRLCGWTKGRPARTLLRPQAEVRDETRDPAEATT